MEKSLLLPFCIILILILIYYGNCGAVLSFFGFLSIYCVSYCFLGQDKNIKTGGFEQVPQTNIWHNPKNFNTDKYKEYQWMLKKIMKKHTPKKRHNGTFLSSLHSLAKVKLNKNKWGYMDDKNPLNTLRFKFGSNIIEKIKESLSGVDMPLFVDYGCGNGLITHALHKLLNAKSFCIDIDDYRKYNESSSFIKNTNIQKIDEHIVDGTLDLISAAQSLHHVNFGNDKDYDYKHTLNTVIQQFYNKLKPNGLLLIREHDVKTINDLYPVLMEHLLYDLLESNSIKTLEDVMSYVNNYHKTHSGWYFSRSYLHDILTSNGFRLLIVDYKKGKNPSSIYNALYIK